MEFTKSSRFAKPIERERKILHVEIGMNLNSDAHRNGGGAKRISK